MPSVTHDRSPSVVTKRTNVFQERNICLTLNLLTTAIVALPSNASKWKMGFNSAFKGLNIS